MNQWAVCAYVLVAFWALSVGTAGLCVAVDVWLQRRRARAVDPRTEPGVSADAVRAYLDQQRAAEDTERSIAADRLIEETQLYRGSDTDYPRGTW